jgi:hypothetical protein
MGQQADSNRKASLDDKKERAAGREERSPQREAIKDFQQPLPAKGQTGGAHGREDEANPPGGGFTQGAGGGGGAPAPAEANHLTVGTKRT